ncbi:MAG: hypothetical protein AAF573_01770 [Bacteroidota bacterium]
MEAPRKDIIDLIEQTPDDYHFSTSKYFGRGFEICNQFLMGFIFYTLIYVLISSLVGVIPFVGEYINQIVVNPVLIIGISILAKKISKREAYSFDNFWNGFNYLKELALAALIQYIAFQIIMAPLWLSGDLGVYQEWLSEWQIAPGTITDFPNFSWWYLALFIPIIYLSVCWMYASLFIVFYQLSAWEALEASRKIIAQRWWMYAGFFLLAGILAVLGALFLGIGMLYTMPVAICVVYASFEDVMRFYVTDEDEDDLLNHLIDNAF